MKKILFWGLLILSATYFGVTQVQKPGGGINIIDSPSDNEVPTYDAATQTWSAEPPPGAGGGEANTGSSVGGGQAVFKQKAALDLEFRSFNVSQFTIEGDQLSVSNGAPLTNIAAWYINFPHLTASRALIIDAQGDPTNSQGVTSTELEYLNDVTSDIQAQIDGKQASDADLTDLADGSLTGSKVGAGISAANVDTGTLPTAVLPTSVVENDQNNDMGEFYIELDDIAAPGNPAAGNRRLFVDTATGELSVRTSGGTTVSLEAAGSGNVSRLAADTVDNTIARWHGTGADIQESSVVIEDDEDITGVKDLTATGVITADSFNSSSTAAGLIKLFDETGNAFFAWGATNTLKSTNFVFMDFGSVPAAGNVLMLHSAAAGATGYQNVATNYPSTGTGNFMRTRTGVYREVYVNAGAMIAPTTAGAAALTTQVRTNIAIDTFEFDSANEESVGFFITFPDTWDTTGDVKFKFHWTTVAGASGGVTWGVAGLSYADDETMDAAMPASVDTDDTWTANEDMLITAASPAVTITGKTAGEPVYFEISRVTGDAQDTMAADAGLIGVMIQYLESATEPSAW